VCFCKKTIVLERDSLLAHTNLFSLELQTERAANFDQNAQTAEFFFVKMLLTCFQGMIIIAT